MNLIISSKIKQKNNTCATIGLMLESHSQSPVVATERSYHMATEKIGIYRRWLEPAPVINSVPVPRKQWPTKRRHCWEVRWFGKTGKRYSKSLKTKKLVEQFARKLQEDVNCVIGVGTMRFVLSMGNCCRRIEKGS